MSDHTGNGHEPALAIVRPRGRQAPDYPAVTLSSGHAVTVRRLSPDTRELLRAQAHKELEAERPQPPTQQVEVGPGETREVTRAQDPDYLKELAAWQQRVNVLGGRKLIALLASYAILNETDAAAVADYRKAMGALGVTLEESDREVYCWHILAPALADQQRLIRFVLGISEPSPEAVQAHQATFRRDVAGPPA